MTIKEALDQAILELHQAMHLEDGATRSEGKLIGVDAVEWGERVIAPGQERAFIDKLKLNVKLTRIGEE